MKKKKSCLIYHRDFNKSCKACQQVGILAKEKRKQKRLRLAKIEKVYAKQVQNLISEDVTKIKGTKTTVTNGFVYAITNPAFPGWIKVGSATDLAARLSSYQTSDPLRQFKIRLTKPVNNRRIAEAKLHKLLEKFEQNNEWFYCNIDQVRNVFQLVDTN